MTTRLIYRKSPLTSRKWGRYSMGAFTRSLSREGEMLLTISIQSESIMPSMCIVQSEEWLYKCFASRLLGNWQTYLICWSLWLQRIKVHAMLKIWFPHIDFFPFPSETPQLRGFQVLKIRKNWEIKLFKNLWFWWPFSAGQKEKK